MERSRWVRRGALALAAAVVSVSLPLIASAHTSSYDSIAKIAPTPAPSPLAYDDLLDQQRYFVCNHGYCIIYTESNGVTDMGVVDYKLAPGAWRSQESVTTAELFTRAANGAQAHHTCQTPALTAESAITGWQGMSDEGKAEPFFAYVPFQKAGAGLGDHAEEWVDDVQALTGVDLTVVSDDPATAALELEALCEDLPSGDFVPADTVQTAAALVNSATTADAVAPLEAQIADLETEISALEDENGTLTNKVTSLKKTIKKLRKKIEDLKNN